jgi:hypothetical protein
VASSTAGDLPSCPRRACLKLDVCITAAAAASFTTAAACPVGAGLQPALRSLPRHPARERLPRDRRGHQHGRGPHLQPRPLHRGVWGLRPVPSVCRRKGQGEGVGLPCYSCLPVCLRPALLSASIFYSPPALFPLRTVCAARVRVVSCPASYRISSYWVSHRLSSYLILPSQCALADALA